MEKELELRMYFFVPQNVSRIYMGIQAGHAALEYADKYGSEEQFIKFVREWKTWIILNGGTTNERRDFDSIAMGSLNQIGDDLLKNDIKFSYFQEPDLNDALTALCFICDERVFDRELYPEFVNFLLDKLYNGTASSESIVRLKMIPNEKLMDSYEKEYKEWVRFVGGVKNVFLRDLIKDKKLA
jgi:hypothetical protein